MSLRLAMWSMMDGVLLPDMSVCIILLGGDATLCDGAGTSCDIFCDVFGTLCGAILLSVVIVSVISLSSMASSSSESDRYVNRLLGSMICLYVLVICFNTSLCVELIWQMEFSGRWFNSSVCTSCNAADMISIELVVGNVVLVGYHEIVSVIRSAFVSVIYTR